jgi:predicted Zn-dependent protease
VRIIKSIVVVAAAMLLVACANSGGNTNGNSNRSANSNASASASSAAPTSTALGKHAVTPVSTTASGENVFTHAEGGIQFEAPPNWKAEAQDDTITITAPDNTVAMTFTVVEQANVEQAASAIDAELEKVMKNAEADGPVAEETHNGLKIYSQSGKGEINGNQIMWGSALIMAKKPVLAFTFAAPGLFEKHEAELGSFIRSIKPIN